MIVQNTGETNGTGQPVPFSFPVLSFLLAAVGDPGGGEIEYSFSFLDARFDEEHFPLLASKDVMPCEFIHREAAGRRMALPAGTGVDMVGFANRFPICGDFEFTARYTIVACDS